MPERSPTTGAVHPPYPEALDRSVAYDGDDLRRELVRELRVSRPTTVVFPDPLDRHPDHRATGLFALLALGDRLARGERLPRLLAYLVHWPGWPPGWNAPWPAPGATEQPLELPPDLPDRGLTRVALSLSRAEVAAKAAALERYATQQEVLVRQAKPGKGGRDVIAISETFRWSPAGNQSRPAEVGHQPEPSVAWWRSDPPCEAYTGSVQAV